MAENTIITGGITLNTQRDITPEELAPNNYLTIIWKDSTGKFINTLDIDNKSALQYTNDLNSAIDNAISNNNVTYAGQNKYINVESIAKYIAQNTIEAGTQRTVVNALIGLASGAGKRTPDNITNLMVNVFGNVADKTARELGFTDPHEVFSQVAGENVIGVFKQLGNKTKDYLDDCISKINGRKKTDLTSSDSKTEKRYVGLLLGLTTNDTESYEVTIPRKKVEDGSDYTTHLLPQHFKKDFTVKLTNKVLSENFSQIDEITNIESVKDKLIEIANSHTLFDVYIRLSADKIYKRANVSFTSLSFEKDESSGNGYTCTFSIEPVNNFKSKTFVSNKKYGNTGSKSSGSGNRKQNTKTSNGKSIVVGWQDGSLRTTKFDSFDQALTHGKLHGYDIYYSENEIPKFRFINRQSSVLKNGTWVLKGNVGVFGNLKDGYSVSKSLKGFVDKNGQPEYIIYKAPLGGVMTSVKGPTISAWKDNPVKPPNPWNTPFK